MIKKSGVIRFSIGGGLAELARDAFWYEQKFEWAEKVLLCFAGITPEDIDAILRGDAYLKPVDAGQSAQLVMREDSQFKSALVKHIDFIKRQVEATHLEVYKLQAAKDRCEFGLFSNGSPETQARVLILNSSIKKLEETSHRYTELLEHYGRLFGQIIKADLFIRIGGYNVPKSMLEEYTNEVVKVLRRSLKMGSLMFQNPLTVLALEERRRALHDRIIDAVGLGKENRTGEQYSKFSGALDRYLESMGAGLFDEGEEA